MLDPSENPVHIRTLEELQSAVVPRLPVHEPPPMPSRSAKRPGLPYDDLSHDINLSPEATSFLRHAAEPHHRSMTLEERWNALGIASGSKKEKILDELRRSGLMRLERKGRSQQVHLYARSYRFLGIPKPSVEGIGGTTHNLAVKKVACLLKTRGYEVRTEQEVGALRKRVDLIAYGPKRILAVEVGLSDVGQEFKNLTEDLQSGVLDLILFVSTDRKILEAVRTRAETDVYLSMQINRIRFFYLDDL